MLAVPPASDGCERLFSSAKLLITDTRLKLTMAIIEANECLRSWFGPLEKSAFDTEKEETTSDANRAVHYRAKMTR